MTILAIETTGPISSAALYRDGDITEIKNEDSYSHLKTLMPMVSELMNKTGIGSDDIDAIAVSQGPGSFTGIRIGMASAKGLAQVWGKPIIEVPTLAGFAFGNYQWVHEDERILLCPVLDAKMHQVYAAAYSLKNKEAKVPGGAYDIKTFLEKLKACSGDFGRIVFFGDGARLYENDLKESGIAYSFAPRENDCQTAYGVAMLSSELFLEGKITDCFNAKPEYFRLPEAERKYRTKMLTIRAADPEDIKAVSEIEKNSFSDPWSEEMLAGDISESLVDKNLSFTVAVDKEPVSYVIAWYSEDKPFIPGEIRSIATAKDRRRQGIARRLLLDLMAKAKKAGVKVLQLEVEDGNTPAICLYETLGFKRVGIRSHYYKNGVDAILMDREL